MDDVSFKVKNFASQMNVHPSTVYKWIKKRNFNSFPGERGDIYC